MLAVVGTLRTVKQGSDQNGQLQKVTLMCTAHSISKCWRESVWCVVLLFGVLCVVWCVVLLFGVLCCDLD